MKSKILGPTEKRIILTGATGFIGQNFLPAILRDKKITKVLLIVRDINKLNRKYRIHPLIEIIQADLALSGIPVVSNYDVLLHLASNIPDKADVLSFSDNARITENIIKSIILKKIVRKVIYASTLDIYGKPIYLPVDENHPTNPLTFYGISKLADELYIKKAAEITGIKCQILRLSQVYGPHEPFVKVIPLFIEKIKSNQQIILNNNGNIIRDWVYIKDVNSALQKSIHTNKSGTFNIATGLGYSLKDLVQILSSKIGKKAKLKFRNESLDLRPEIVLSIDEARKRLDYKPLYNLKKGITDYLERS